MTCCNRVDCTELQRQCNCALASADAALSGLIEHRDQSITLAIVSICPIGCIDLSCLLSLKDATLCEMLNVRRQRCCIIHLARSKRMPLVSMRTNAFADHHSSDQLSRSVMLGNRAIAGPREVSARSHLLAWNAVSERHRPCAVALGEDVPPADAPRVIGLQYGIYLARGQTSGSPSTLHSCFPNQSDRA